MFDGLSDAECVRWWQEFGRRGDYLEETGEPMSEVAIILGLDEDYVDASTEWVGR